MKKSNLEFGFNVRKHAFKEVQMKKLLSTHFPIGLAMLCFLLFPFLALAQDPTVIVPPSAADFAAFLAALGGAKTLGVLGIVAVVVQGLMLLLKSKLGEMAGKYQLILVMLLTMVTGALALRMSGLDWASVLMHSTTLTAVQVFLHQLYTQFLEKPVPVLK